MFYFETNEGFTLQVKISPNASSLAIKGIFTDSDNKDFLKITVVSVPEKGKANKELIKFLSKELGIPKSDIEIVSGETGHFKKILLKHKSEQIMAKFDEWNRKIQNDS